MSLKYVYIGCVLAAVSGATTTAAVVEINVGGYYFSPQFANVQPGDTIRWIHDEGNHDVTSGAGCSGVTSHFYSPITTVVPQFEWTVPASLDGEVIPYYCSVGNHCVASDQFGALLVNVQAHYVTTNGFVYEPPAITVDAGDAVFWLHAGGTHTVTSGIGCLPDGRFDEPLSNLDPMPFYVVPEDEPSGTIDYYCTPHCGFGMVGTIDVMGTAPLGACCMLNVLCYEDMTQEDCESMGDTWYGGQSCAEADCLVYGSCCVDAAGGGTECLDLVQETCVAIGGDWAGWMHCDELPCATCPEDVNGDGVVGVDDLLQLLAVYGNSCSGCPEDIDGDGVVGVDDLLQLLAVYGGDC